MAFNAYSRSSLGAAQDVDAGANIAKIEKAVESLRGHDKGVDWRVYNDVTSFEIERSWR